MRRFGFLQAAVPLTALALSACVQVYPPETAPAPAQQQARKSDATAKKGPFKPYSEVLKDTRAIEGYFTFHLKRDNTLFLEIAPDQLGKDFGLVMHFSRGLGEFNVHAGLILSRTQLMRFDRTGDKILLVHRNDRFTADPGSPMRVSMEQNVGHSIVGAFDIKAEHEETKNLVIDVTSFFVSDYADVARGLKFYYANKPVSFDKGRSYIDKVQGFPKNVEIDALLTYKANDFPRSFPAGVSDFRSVPIGVRYSLFALPEQLMRPRYGDDRIGTFLVATRDFSRDREWTPYLRYVRRWRLEKKDPKAWLSEPIEPIVFYIDRSVPHEYRRYVKEGIEAWNKAFEAAGFEKAIVARDAPSLEEDPTWSAEDIRYSTVQWTAANRMGYAIGPSQSDPRTGEQLNADVLISSTFVTGWLYEYAEMVGPDGLMKEYMEAQAMLERLPPWQAEYVCLAEIGKAHQLGVQYAMLLATGAIEPGQPMPEEYLGDAIRDLVMHEVGHTLALRHNFKASAGVPYDRLQDRAFTRENGVMVSVMDYGPVNIAVDPKRQGYYWNPEVGAHDLWTIRYAYSTIRKEGSPGTDGQLASTPEDELPGLRKIAAEVADPLHTYGSDGDNWIGPFAVDPLTSAWDLGSDPLAYARDRVAIINRVQPKLESRLIGEGDSYLRLRGALSSVIFERFISLFPTVKNVGGLYFNRDHKGDPGGRLPFTPVPAARQREAVQLIVSEAFAEGALEFDPEMLNKLAPNRWSHWGTPPSAPVDYPIHTTVADIQRTLMEQLLHPVRIQRMIDNELRQQPGGVYTAAQLFNEITEATWSELAGQRARNVGSFRRNLQRIHTDALIELMLSQSAATPPDARSLARLQLKRIAERTATALGQSGLNDFTRAHLDETQARIERALNAQVSLTIED